MESAQHPWVRGGMKPSMIVLQSRLLCQMFAGLAPPVSIYLNKSSKEHTDAEPSAKGFFAVHQSSGKYFTLFIVVACLVRRKISLRHRFSEMGEI